MAFSSVEPFPWETLPALTRSGLNARLAAEHSFDLARLGACLHDLLQLDLEEIQIIAGAQPAVAQVKFADCWLQLPSLDLRLRVEPELGALAVSRLLGKSLQLDTGQDLSPGMHGAFTAIVQALGRRLARHEPPHVEPAAARASSSGLDWHVDFTLRINGAWYRGALAASATLPALPARRPPNPQLAACLPVRLEAIVATCRLSIAELAALSVGDILLPGDGWLGAPDASGTCYLSAPGAETALHVSPRGPALQFNAVVQLAAEPLVETEAPGADIADAAALEAHLRASTQLALVEVGSLTLPASEWLALKPGDPLPSPQLAERGAVLRVASKRLAWGDLVTVEGQPGLCIRGLFDSSLGTQPLRALGDPGV